MLMTKIYFMLSGEFLVEEFIEWILRDFCRSLFCFLLSGYEFVYLLCWESRGFGSLPVVIGRDCLFRIFSWCRLEMDSQRGL